MARPRNKNPTPAELEVLKILWNRGELTVREVLGALKGRQRAYTSVMSLLNVMTEKGLLQRKPMGRAFVYSPKVTQERTIRSMVGDLLSRAFEGSASALVAHVLEQTNPSKEELDRIHDLIEAHGESQRAGSRRRK